MTNIVSFSGGKDSTAMLLMMLEKKEKIHSAVHFETEREFPEILSHIEKITKEVDVKIQKVRYWIDFDFLEDRYGRPHPSGGWCAARKANECNKYMRLMVKDNPKAVECIGFASDERNRAEKLLLSKSKKWPLRFPLIEWEITEKMALEYCYDKGYLFDNIYDWMPSKRVSCYDCVKQSEADWNAIKKYHPELLKGKKYIDFKRKNK